MLKVVVKLVSTVQIHGTKGVKPEKVHSKAATKFKATLNSRLSSSTSEDAGDEGQKEDKPKPSSSNRKAPKPYGKHNGNKHVAILREIELEPAADTTEFCNYVTNLTSNFEGRNSWDLRAAKHEYRTYKDALTKQFADKYGTELSEKVSTEYMTILNRKSFYYTSHQIEIVIESDEPIQGGVLGREEHYFVNIKSKMIYSQGKQFLSDADIKMLKGLPSDKVALRVSTITRVPISLAWNAKEERYLVTWRGSGQIKALDFYASP